jgi:nicotinamidase-related amidase
VHRAPFANLIPAPAPLHLAGPAPALLVVDFQVAAADPGAGLGRHAAERGLEPELSEYYEQVAFARRNAADLLGAFRAHGRPVLFTRRAGAPSASRPPWVAETDDPEAAIVGDLAPGASEPVITRSAENPFAGGHLERALACLPSVGPLVVCGLFVPGAVDLAVREARDRGGPVVLAQDACAGETYALHECVTARLAGGPVRLRSTAALLALLDGPGAGPRASRAAPER